MSSNGRISINLTITKVFNNQYIIRNILNYLSDDIMSHLDIRRLNKSFNTEILGIIRKNHRKIIIEIFDDRVNKPYHILAIRGPIPKGYVYVNYKRVMLTKLDRYFGFLNNVAGTKVEKVDTKGLWEIHFSFRIHRSIHSTLIRNNREYIRSLCGMRGICFQCTDCLDLAKKCHEFGLIHYDSLVGMYSPCHFKKLIINDGILDQFANSATKTAQTKEECFEKLNELMGSFISCDQLTLQVSESRQLTTIKNGVKTKERRRDHRIMPREILELMLEKWNVKSVGLEFHSENYECVQYDTWSQKGWFTKFKFSDPYGTVERIVWFFAKY